MRMRFVSGSVTPASCARKRSDASTCTSGTWKWSPNVSTTCSASSCAQQAVVDEDARQLVADRRGGRAARRRRSRRRRRGRRSRARRRPGRGSARPARRSRRAPSTSPAHGRRRVRKFLSMSVPRGVCCTSGWNCTRVEAALGILHRGDRRRGRRGGHAEAVGRAHDGVVVAHPAGVDVADVVQQHAAADVELGLAELGAARARDVAAERLAPWPACRSRCRAPGSRARAAADRAAARPRRRSRPGRPRG